MVGGAYQSKGNGITTSDDCHVVEWDERANSINVTSTVEKNNEESEFNYLISLTADTKDSDVCTWKTV